MRAGLFSAWRLMVVAGWRNRVLRQLRRLKKPRYLAASLIGLAYFFWIFGLQRRSLRYEMNVPEEYRYVMEVTFIGFAFVAVLFAWIFGSDRAALSFSETEVQFFFPAPYSRRQLLRFKLLRALTRTALSAAITTLFVGRGMPSLGFFFVGSFIGLGTLSFHVTGASFIRESLLTFGLSGIARRLLPPLLFVALVGGTLLFTWRHAPPVDFSSAAGAFRWLRDVVEAPPLGWLLYPIRASVKVATASDLQTFLSWLPPALLVLVIHYLWVERSDVSFEEASLAAAERRAKWTEARQTPTLAPSGSVKSWRLAVPGPAEVAIVWKNVIAARRVYSLRLLPSLLLIAGALAASSIFLVPRRGGGSAFAIGFFCAIAAVMLVLVGPSAARVDLRHDLPSIDVLRAWPLSGFQVMRAEVFGAALMLGSLQWLLLAAAFGFTSTTEFAGIGASERAAILVTLALLCPTFSLSGLVVQNAAALMFPSWIATDATQQRGIEVMGQRLLTLVGTWLVLLIAVVPVGGIGAAIALVCFPLFGFWSLAAGAAVAAGLLTASALAATFALGTRFERFDPTE